MTSFQRTLYALSPYVYRHRRLIAYHALCWILFAYYEGVLVSRVAFGQYLSFGYIVAYYLTFVGLFYTNALVLLPFLLARKHYVLYLLSLVAALALTVLVKYGWQYYLLPNSGVPVILRFRSLREFITINTYYCSGYVIYSFAYWFAARNILLEKERRRLETQLLESKLSYLRLQINPHFLFNILNFFYGKALTQSKPLADGVILLSDMMRYSLSEDEPDKQVELSKEITHVTNFIRIQQLRFNDELQIDFQTRGNFTGKRVLPLILITFIENVFKHGELHDKTDPAQIFIFLENNELTLYTHNRYRMGMKEPSTGIGVANCRNRLDLVYKGNYSLIVNQEPDFYNCSLSIRVFD